MANWIVSGAASGIGRGIAEAAIRAGHDSVLLDVDKDGLDEVVAASGGMARGIATDLSDQAGVDIVVADLGNSGFRIDTASLNIGIEFDEKPLVEHSVDEILKLVSVNLVGTILLVRGLVPFMTEGSSITLMSSGAGMRGGNAHNASVYAATKHALIGFSNALCLELGRLDLRVNCISPGGVETPLLRRMFGDRLETEFNAKSAIPIGRRAVPHDIAQAVMYLASARQVTGANLVVDGGYTLK